VRETDVPEKNLHLVGRGGDPPGVDVLLQGYPVRIALDVPQDGTLDGA